MILGQMSTGQTVLKRSNTGNNRKMKLYTALLACYSSDTNVLSTHPSRVSSRRLVSISFCNASHPLSLIIASAGFLSPLTHRISVISRRSYDCLRHRRSIINRFSCVVPSLTRHSYKDLESIHVVRGIFPWAVSENVWFNVDFIVAATSNPRDNAYSSGTSEYQTLQSHRACGMFEEPFPLVVPFQLRLE